MRVRWDGDTCEPHVYLAGYAGPGAGSSAGPATWLPRWLAGAPAQAESTDAVAACRGANVWLADESVRTTLNGLVTNALCFATEAQFGAALLGDDRVEVIDQLAMGLPFVVGDHRYRIVWRYDCPSVVPLERPFGTTLPAALRRLLPASTGSAPDRQRDCCARLARLLDSVPGFASHRHIGREPCAPANERRELGALQNALTHYVTADGISADERHTREEVVLPKLLALWGNQGNALSLCDLHLSAVPDVFGWLPHLQHVSLEANTLTSLPPSFARLLQLTSLRLDRNAFTELPDPIRALARLTRLNLTSNAIGTVAEWVGDLPSLQILDVSHNRIVSLPDSIGRLSSLARLNLNGNRIADLPGSTANLPQLRSVSWTANEVRRIPQVLDCLSPSCFVDLRGNPALALEFHAARSAGAPRRADSVIHDLPR